MKYYPAYLDLRKRRCVVIGGGAVAERKTLSLLDAGAVVTIISPTLTQKLQALSDSKTITHCKKLYEGKDLIGAYLVIAATDSPEVNTRVATACRKQDLLVNVAVPPEESSFIVPSALRRGDLLIAISTSGASPALSRKIRQELEQQYGAEYELFLEMLSAIRTRVLDEIQDEKKRKAVLLSIGESDVLGLLRQGKKREAELLILSIAGLKKQKF